MSKSFVITGNKLIAGY